jgi:signal transduction histidine kinase
LSFIVHDLRTPLNAIALASDVLDETLPGTADGERTAGMLKMLRRNVGQLQGLVARVLKESAQIDKQAVDNLKRREIDLWLLVEALIGDLQPLSITAGSELINQVPSDLVVYADNKLLRRVFQNLLANAMKYAPRSRVRVQARPLDPTGAVECRVTDDGPGIPPERLAVIFDKLETDPGHDDGVGLGLAIVKTIVEAHGGAVGCSSEQGKGTEFWLRLPGRGKDAPG